MPVDFSRLRPDQRRKLSKHLQDFKSNARLMQGCDGDRLERIQREIRCGGSLIADTDIHMLGVYIANTYRGKDGAFWSDYLCSLGLSPNLW